jgi:hypothetical protein
MLTFDVKPFVGALPIRFGMSRLEVHRILGNPESSYPIWDKSGTSEYWLEFRICVGFDLVGQVMHVGFTRPDCFSMVLFDATVWSLEVADPNPVLLQFDGSPVEDLGILVFTNIGIATTGFHDDDEHQRALTVFPHGAYDKFLATANAPDLRKYQLSEINRV